MAVKSDKEFIRSFSMVMLGVGVIGLVCFILAITFGWGVDYHPAAEKTLKAQRLEPVAQVVTNPAALEQKTQAKAASQPKLSGEQVVAQVCSACHGTGMLGSPKIGDAAAWGERFKTQGGLDGLAQHAIHGLNLMPPRGGDSALSDQEIHEAVKYMLSKAGISG